MEWGSTKGFGVVDRNGWGKGGSPIVCKTSGRGRSRMEEKTEGLKSNEVVSYR